VPPHLVTSLDVQRGKPDPEPFEKGAAVLGFAPGDCIVLEDTSAGIRAAKAAGARVIALRTTVPDAELSAAGADWLAKDCASLAFSSLDGAGQLSLLLNARD
jgi:beta-phosphoglucomutase-like phosphatase (HAD superfamily)